MTAARAVTRAGRLTGHHGFGVGLNMAVWPFGKESSQGPAAATATAAAVTSHRGAARYGAPCRAHAPPRL